MKQFKIKNEDIPGMERAAKFHDYMKKIWLDVVKSRKENGISFGEAQKMAEENKYDATRLRLLIQEHRMANGTPRKKT